MLCFYFSADRVCFLLKTFFSWMEKAQQTKRIGAPVSYDVQRESVWMVFYFHTPYDRDWAMLCVGYLCVAREHGLRARALLLLPVGVVVLFVCRVLLLSFSLFIDASADMSTCLPCWVRFSCSLTPTGWIHSVSHCWWWLVRSLVHTLRPSSKLVQLFLP